jgi:hypothetical protein
MRVKYFNRERCWGGRSGEGRVMFAPTLIALVSSAKTAGWDVSNLTSCIKL